MQADEIIKRGEVTYEFMRKMNMKPNVRDDLLFEACNALKKLLSTNKQQAKEIDRLRKLIRATNMN